MKTWMRLMGIMGGMGGRLGNRRWPMATGQREL